jgi:hypothetical protein
LSSSFGSSSGRYCGMQAEGGGRQRWRATCSREPPDQIAPQAAGGPSKQAVAAPESVGRQPLPSLGLGPPDVPN